MNRVFLVFILFCVKLFPGCHGLCIVPVADLLKKSAAQTFKNFSNIEQAYKSLLMGDTNCKREYQILYNELVEIIQIQGNEVQIRVPHIIYYDEELNVYTNVYWTLLSNLVCIDQLKLKSFNLKKIPEEISFSQKLKPDYSVVVLNQPFFYSDDLSFSVGTRFKAKKKTLNLEYISCYAIDKNSNEIILQIPRNKLNFYKDESVDKRISNFVSLLRSWANLDAGFIPYLYSGSSYIYAYKKDEILKRESDNTFYKDELKVYPYVGFDCSCIISRGAQICNLPYFYKDSITLQRNLVSFNDFNKLKDGDIIWFPGHVVIVSDIKNNLVLEARGYASGFGRVHECHISKMFENINNYEDLFFAKNNNQELRLLAKDGSLRYVITEYKILSFKSGLYKEFKSLCEPVNKLDTSRCFKVL